MNKLIAFTGKKGSGKNTLANFLFGLQLKSNKVVENFGLDDKGGLFLEQDGKTFLLDTNRNDIEFASVASQTIWPFVKNYAYATPLKEMIIGLFKVDRKYLYGTDEDKNTLISHLLWENMPGVNNKIGPMSAREFMQFFGTDIMRKIYGPIWSEVLIDEVSSDRSDLSIITDLRFDNEAEDLINNKDDKLKDFDIRIVQLTRFKDADDNHLSEKGVNPKYQSFLLDNANMTLEETCIALTKEMENWGWLEKNV